MANMALKALLNYGCAISGRIRLRLSTFNEKDRLLSEASRSRWCD